ncbi:LytR/AlgR family response regulator transcription factor [Dyadobacter sediminis]|uniref:Response regulator transcription factor n=1 Tax=Dyadobacter sediminis TaxID=1493691 RepID=A0A5R9KIJ6_9BACT|nr:LytTR family DNA-binding domain-containing protein [Dyadobacter sediminis]TLU96040.1 response regulator transcription factor [Dyadobacter sediminis]GGB78742.1 DNA-binding response regulator [Dyadobacter sediminis]
MAELNRISALIVDDERSAINNLRLALLAHCPQVNVSAHAQTVQQALAVLASENIEILFLDIRLQNETGFDLLRQMNFHRVSVIFVTAHDDYGIQAIKFSATDYLLKPLDVQELSRAVEKAGIKKKGRDRELQMNMLIQSFENMHSLRQKKIALPEAAEIHYVLIDDIVFCRSSNSYTTFYVKDLGEIIVSKPINEYESLLEPYGFLRTHQSFLVNKNRIVSYKKEDGGFLLMEGGQQVLLSRQRKHLLKELFT